MFYEVISILIVVALFFIFLALRHIGDMLYMLTKNICTIGEMYNEERNKKVK